MEGENRVNEVGEAFNCDRNGRQELICGGLGSSDEFFRCNLPRGHLRWKVENGGPITSEGVRMADLSEVLTDSL